MRFRSGSLSYRVEVRYSEIPGLLILVPVFLKLKIGRDPGIPGYRDCNLTIDIISPFNSSNVKKATLLLHSSYIRRHFLVAIGRRISK